MNDLNLTAWMIARGDPYQDRNRAHLIALADARRDQNQSWRERLVGLTHALGLVRHEEPTNEGCPA